MARNRTRDKKTKKKKVITSILKRAVKAERLNCLKKNIAKTKATRKRENEKKDVAFSLISFTLLFFLYKRSPEKRSVYPSMLFFLSFQVHVRGRLSEWKILAVYQINRLRFLDEAMW